MRRFLAAAVFALCVLAAAGAADARASAACEVPRRAARAWETDPSHVAFRLGHRLYGCSNGEVFRLGSAAGVERVAINGYGLGLLRSRGPGRCRSAEAFDLVAETRISKVVVGCRRRVLRLRVTTDAILALQLAAAGGRSRVEQIVDSRRHVLEEQADRRAVSRPFHGVLAFWKDGAERQAVLGRTRCGRRGGASFVLTQGDVSVWSESGDDGQNDLDAGRLMTCDSQVGVVFVVGTGRGCGSWPVAIRLPYVAIQDDDYSYHCNESSIALRILELPSGRSTDRVSAPLPPGPVSVRITPTANLVLTAQDGYPPTSPVRVLYATRLRTEVLDPGPDVDPDSLTLDGDVASWVSGGVTRSARTP